MSRVVQEIETLLEALCGEYTRLIKLVDDQQIAMRKLDLATMEKNSRLQEASRLRMTSLENKRRAAVASLVKLHSFTGTMRVEDIARLYPQHSAKLLAHRAQLKSVVAHLGNRAYIAGRIAGAVLGHLNTVVRLIAGAAEKAGVYTKRGSPQLSGRIGMMDAKG